MGIFLPGRKDFLVWNERLQEKVWVTKAVDVAENVGFQQLSRTSANDFPSFKGNLS